MALRRDGGATQGATHVRRPAINDSAISAGLGAPFELSRWAVRYPWVDEAWFESSSPLLDAVWTLC